MSAAATDVPQETLLDAALRYARLGWPIIPLSGKLPRTEHGVKDATTDEAAIRDWWRRWPQANIGLATGHRFWVLDIDLKSGGEETLEDLEAKHGRLPDTLTQITGTGGRHYLFALPHGFRVTNTQGKIGPGIDTRGMNGYIVAAPSVHPATRRPYVWDGLAEVENQPIAAAPAWLLALLNDGKPATDREVPLKIPHGKQHSTLVSIAGTMRRRGLGVDEIFAALWQTNASRCERPGPEENIRRIAESVCRYPAGELPKRDGPQFSSEPPETPPPPSEEEEKQAQPRAEHTPPKGKPSAAAAALLKITALDEDYDEPDKCGRPIIEGLLNEGLTMLHAPAKKGKTFLAVQIAKALITGEALMEKFNPVTSGHVLYISEMTTGQLRRRTKAAGLCRDDHASLLFTPVHGMLPWTGGGAEQLETTIATLNPRPVLVIADSLLGIIKAQKRDGSVCVQEYSIVDRFKRIFEQTGVSILVIHHSRKLKGDAVESAMGTGAIPAAVDDVWCLARDGESAGEAILTCEGRDAQERIYRLRQGEVGFWSLIAGGGAAILGAVRRRVLEYLKHSPGATAPRIAEVLGMNPKTVATHVTRLSTTGLVIKLPDGGYGVSDSRL